MFLVFTYVLLNSFSFSDVKSKDFEFISFFLKQINKFVF